MAEKTDVKFYMELSHFQGVLKIDFRLYIQALSFSYPIFPWDMKSDFRYNCLQFYALTLIMHVYYYLIFHSAEKTRSTKLRKTLMKSSMTVRSIALIVLASVVSGSFAGCGGNSEQRQSGTLATPIDAVEKAGELAGKAADAKQAPAKKK